jgi:hypothetical protein
MTELGGLVFQTPFIYWYLTAVDLSGLHPWQTRQIESALEMRKEGWVLRFV